jgi:uncharacterized protein (TIGR03437 family)
VTGQLYFAYNANIANRVDSSGNLVNVTFSSTSGSASLALINSTTLQGNITYTVPAPPVVITLNGVRVAAANISGGTATLTNATVTVSGVPITVSSAPSLPVGVARPSLLQSIVSNGQPCSGSTTPATIDFPTLISTGTVQSTIRVTEAAPEAFLSNAQSLQGIVVGAPDTGVRIIVNLSGYAAGTRLFVPTAIVGSTGNVPTSAGSFGGTISGGVYTPSSNQLLLSLVNGASASGAGGTLAIPPPLPLIQTTYTAATEITGQNYVVYEVLDSNLNLNESAQIPIFESSPNVCPSGSEPSYTVSLAPVSNVSIGTQTDPIPRFVAVTPGSDCQQIGDCNYTYYPRLLVTQTSVALTGTSLGAKVNGYIQEGNAGNGILPFQASITYQSGSNWLSITPASGDTNSTTLNLVADPGALAPGTYQATVTINAGTYGSASVPVTFTVGAPGVTIQAVVNGATFKPGSIAPGSLASIFGLNLSGSNVQVLFNGLTGTVVYDGASQINVLVPAALATTTANVVVAINGQQSNSFPITLAANAPAIFNTGVLDQNNSLNSAAQPETRGNTLQIFLTGLASPTPNPVTVNIGSQTGIATSYAGPAPGINGLEQVNVQIPLGLTLSGNSAPLAICIPAAAGQQQCSPAVTVYLK